MAQAVPPVEDRRSDSDRICVVCLQGYYVTRAAEDYREKDPERSPWHVEACTNCGHVQLFRRDWRVQ
jgi:hypothetical protein